MRIHFEIPSPSDARFVHVGKPRSRMTAFEKRAGPFAPLLILLNALVDINCWVLERSSLPPIYGREIAWKRLRSPLFKIAPHDRLIRYQAETPGNEEWLSIDVVHERGEADCEDLACARCAEYRVWYGIAARPAIKWRWIGDLLLIHVMVWLPLHGGLIEDPSYILGMRGEYQ